MVTACFDVALTVTSDDDLILKINQKAFEEEMNLKGDAVFSNFSFAAGGNPDEYHVSAKACLTEDTAETVDVFEGNAQAEIRDLLANSGGINLSFTKLGTEVLSCTGKVKILNIFFNLNIMYTICRFYVLKLYD